LRYFLLKNGAMPSFKRLDLRYSTIQMLFLFAMRDASS